MSKIAIVAGGCGLIGKAIVEGLHGIVDDVFMVDISGNPDFKTSIFDTDFLTIIDMVKPCIFVDATYPVGINGVYVPVINSVCSKMSGAVVLLSSIYGNVSHRPENYKDTTVKETPLEYGFIKAGIIQLTRMLAVKYAPKLRVNCVSPGGVFDNQDPVFVERYCKNVPMGRMATPEDIAGPVCFLASDEAKYVTGINLKIDGGLCAW